MMRPNPRHKLCWSTAGGRVRMIHTIVCNNNYADIIQGVIAQSAIQILILYIRVTHELVAQSAMARDIQM